MMTDDQPTQPLTDEAHGEIRDWHNKTRDRRAGALLAEVDRIQAELAEVTTARNYLATSLENQIDAHERTTQRLENIETENSAILRRLEEQYRLRAENARLRKQVQDYHESADAHVAKFDRKHERLMEAEGRIDAARELHEPAQSSAWNYIYCASGCGAGPLQGPDPWPCSTAKALGMTKGDNGE